MNRSYMQPIIAGLLIFLVSGCQGFVYERKLIYRFYLIAVDSLEDMTVCYRIDTGSFIGIIGDGVFSVGNNDDYIIAMQHPMDQFRRMDRSKINYYIIRVKGVKPFWPEKSVTGPLRADEFYLQRKELGIPENLDFTVEFSDLR